MLPGCQGAAQQITRWAAEGLQAAADLTLHNMAMHHDAARGVPYPGYVGAGRSCSWCCHALPLCMPGAASMWVSLRHANTPPLVALKTSVHRLRMQGRPPP